MLVTLFPITTSSIDERSLNQEPIVAQLSSIFLSPEQPLNAELPMLVTLLGIVMLVSPLQPSNAYFPMLVTLLGIVMLVSPEHS